MSGRLVTATFAARYVGLSVDTLRDWAKAGKVPCVVDPDSKRRRYSLPALDRWLENNCPSEAAS